MSRPPIIQAVITGKDDLSPLMEKIAANALQIAERMGVFSNAFGKADMNAADLQRRFRQIAETTRLAFDTNAATRFSGAIDKAGVAMTTLQNKAALAHKEVGALARSLENIKQMASMTIGFEITRGGFKIVESAAEVQQAQNKVRNAGNNEAEVKEATKIAERISQKYPSATQTQALDDYIETRSMAYKDGKVDYKLADRNVEATTKARRALRASGYDFTPHDAKNIGIYLDNTGQGDDPAAYERTLEQYVKGKQVFGDAIDTAKLRDMSSNAKSSNFNVSPETLPIHLARMSGSNASRYGNEQAQVQTTLIGGKMTKQSAMYLVDRGMINEDQIVSGEGGKFYIKGDIKSKELLSTNPTQWAQDVMLPALIKKGVISDEKVETRMKSLRAAEEAANPGAKINEKELRNKATASIVREDMNEYLKQREAEGDKEGNHERAKHGLISDDLAKSGFRSTVIDYLAHAIANEAQIKRDVDAQTKAAGFKAGENIDKSSIAALEEFQNAFTTFAGALGGPVMADAAKTLHAMAGYVADLTASLQAWQEAHPDLAKAIAVGTPAGAAIGGTGLALGAFRGLLNGFGLSSSAVALDGSAAALTAAAVKLGASGGIPGAITSAATTATSAVTGAGLSGALPATGAAIGAVGTGSIPAAAVGGATLAGLFGSAAYAISELNKYAEKNGKSGWDFGRLWSNIVNGQDRAVPDAKTDPEGHARHIAEQKAELEKRIAERDKWKAEHGDKPMPHDMNKPPTPKTWREWLFGDGTGPKIGTGMYNLHGPGVMDTATDIRRKRKDDDLDPDAPRRHWTGQVVGISEALKPPQEVKVESKVDVKGDAEVHIAPIHVKVDGTTVIPGTTVRVPLNTGSQGAGTGSTLAGGRAPRSALQ